MLDLRWKKFGRLTVLSRTATQKSRGMWSCQCDCGKTTTVSTSNLKRNKVRSCGCLKKEVSAQSIKKIIGYNTLSTGEAVFNALYKDYKISALYKKLEFDLSKNDFKRLTKQNCKYCNTEPKHLYKKKNLNGGYVGNGVDRLDSNKGYTYDNVVPCCKTCNTMKNTLSVEEFVLHIQQISINISRIKEFLCL